MDDEMLCGKCGSDKVVPYARVKEWGPSQPGLTVEVDEHPHALMFKGTVVGNVGARICGQCGFIELYAGSPETLWAAYERGADGKK